MPATHKSRTKMPVFLGWLPLKIYFEGTWRKNSENSCQKPTNIWNISVFLGFTIQPVISRFWNPLVTAPWNCESLWLVLNIQLQPWDVQSFFLHAVKGQPSPRKRSGRMGKEEMNDEKCRGWAADFFPGCNKQSVYLGWYQLGVPTNEIGLILCVC